MAEYIGVAATDGDYELAEGVLWDDRAQLVRWVDILKGRILAGRLDDTRLTDITEITIGQTAGAIALAEDGGLLVAGARGLVTVSSIGALSFGPDLVGDRTGFRLNDGTVDLYGAFLVGTLSLGERTNTDVLLRVYPNGRVETLRTGLGLSNGVAFSPDGEAIYHVDTLAGTVSRHSYGPGPFDRQEPWMTVIADFPDYPDGLTVDSTGALWVARWGGASVHRYSPAGELLDIVSIEATQASCPGFVGPNLDRLAITSAQLGLDDLDDQAGAIFLADVGATSLPPNRWAGSTSTPHWLLPQREQEDA